MSLELIVRPEAEADALEAFRWYNEQVPGLGQEFLEELDRVMDSIQQHPQIHSKVHRELRRPSWGRTAA
jgi:plasmid stabilization system protein ParE